MTFTDSIPHLKIEVLENGNIRLENESMGDSYAVDIHPIHLQHLAEKMGLAREVTVTASELVRDMGRYKRALVLIRDRAEQLHQNIYGLSQLGHEDMSIEVAQSAALADIADHICVEFERSVHEPLPDGHEASPPIQPTQPAQKQQLEIEV